MPPLFLFAPEPPLEPELLPEPEPEPVLPLRLKVAREERAFALVRDEVLRRKRPNIVMLIIPYLRPI